MEQKIMLMNWKKNLGNNKVYGFWISPDANIYPILNDFGHQVFMEKYLGKTFNTDEETIEETLNQGWIRIVNNPKYFMLDYRYIMNNKQLSSIKKIDEQLQEDGYFHSDYILSYGREYYNFSCVKDLIARIRLRSCDK